jgi:DNA-binding IclR family transcriptional regulator
VSGVTRGLTVLEQLVAAEEPPSHTDLARATGLPKSTLTNVLAELTRLEYVDPVEKGYRPGARLLTLGYRLARRLGVPPEVPEGVHALLERLARDTGETAVFSVEVGRTPELAGELLALDHVESPHAMRYVPGIGQLQPVAHTAAGYVLLAFTRRDSRAIRPDTLFLRTPTTLVDPPAIDDELARTRRRGYARNVDRSTAGVTSLAFPWPRGSADVVGAITVVGPTPRVEPAERRLVQAVRAALKA